MGLSDLWQKLEPNGAKTSAGTVLFMKVNHVLSNIALNLDNFEFVFTYQISSVIPSTDKVLATKSYMISLTLLLMHWRCQSCTKPSM